MDLAAARPDPIPCFTEMSSGNPVFVLPGALRKGANELAKGLFGSFTLGAGQFCTKPGIVLVPESDGASDFIEELQRSSRARALRRCSPQASRANIRARRRLASRR